MYELWVTKCLCVLKPVTVNLIIRDRTSVTATIRKIYHPWQTSMTTK